jgi:hypothetical protein
MNENITYVLQQQKSDQSAWDDSDKNNYNNSTSRNIGQIGDTGPAGDLLAKWISILSSNEENKTFLEIGTWNGLGSTKCFADSLRKRDDDYIFYSLECNKEKSKDAERLYINDEKIHILNEVIYNNLPDNFYDMYPETRINETYKHWVNVDSSNMKNCSVFLDRTNIPDVFDVILLDGGVFITYFEYHLLKDRCKYLLLDDTNIVKNVEIVKDIKSQPRKWKILEENSESRNGSLVCQRI